MRELVAADKYRSANVEWRASEGSGGGGIQKTERQDFIDVDYWADPERKFRRKSGKQELILTATSACSKAEWLMLLAGLGMDGEMGS